MRSIPALFFIHFGRTYRYEGPLTYESVMNFCQNNYKTAKTLSLWENPVGPVGKIKGYLVRIGLDIAGIPSILQQRFSIPEWLSFVITGLALILGIISVTVFCILMQLSKIKEE